MDRWMDEWMDGWLDSSVPSVTPKDPFCNCNPFGNNPFCNLLLLVTEKVTKGTQLLFVTSTDPFSNFRRSL